MHVGSCFSQVFLWLASCPDSFPCTSWFSLLCTGPKELGYIIRFAGDRVVVVDADLLGQLAQVPAADFAEVGLVIVCGLDEQSGGWQVRMQARCLKKCTSCSGLTTLLPHNIALARSCGTSQEGANCRGLGRVSAATRSHDI
jgi:hypothetical protein